MCLILYEYVINNRVILSTWGRRSGLPSFNNMHRKQPERDQIDPDWHI